MATTFNHNNEVFVKDGKLGVGQSSPTDDLHVDGVIRGTQIKINTGNRFLRFSGITLSLLSANEGSVTSGATNVAVGRLGLGSTYSQIDIGGHDKGYNGYTAAIWANSTKASAFRVYNTSNENSLDITNTGNVGIGVSSASEKLHVNGKIAIVSTNTKLEQGTSNSLRIQTNYGRVDIGPQNTGWCHFTTDRNQFYFGSRAEIAGEFVPYQANQHNLGTSSKPWIRIYGTTIYQGSDRVLATRGDVHSELYSTGGNADDYTQFGIYRNYGEGQPTGLGHNTLLNVMQQDGNYGWQITSSTAGGGDSMWYRQKGTTFGDGTWHQIASRAWVQAQGFITSQTDSQTLSWNGSNGQLTISNGNTVDLDGRYLESLPSHNHSADEITSGTLNADRLPWQSNDGFSGTYSLVWRATNTPYTASWLNVNGTLDQLNSRRFGSYGGDTAVLFQSYNASASNAEQFRINHDYGRVEFSNPRGDMEFKTPTYFETTAVAETTLYVGDSIQHWGDGGTGMYFNTDQVDIRTGGTQRLLVNSSGNVGIGTTTPNHKLDIYSDTNMPLRIHRPNSALNTTEPVGIGFSHRGDNANSTTDTRAGIFSSYNGDLFLSVDQGGRVDDDPIADAALFIEGSNSYVGIGTITPESRLTIAAGSSGADTILMVGEAGNGNIKTRHIEGKSHNSNADGILHLNYYTNQNVSIAAGGGNITTGSGNLGLGTSSPQSKLDVHGVITLSGDNEHTLQKRTTSTITSEATDITELRGRQIDFYAYDDIWLRAGTSDDIGFIAGGSTRAIIKNTGNVGIGTTSPSSKLQVNGTAQFGNSNIYLKVESNRVVVENNYLFASYQSGVSFYAYESVFRGLVRSDSSGDNALKLGDTVERMRIVGGNVGIGTTSPAEKLDVANGNAQIGGNVLPRTDRAHTLGLDNKRWQIVFCETLDSAGQHESNLQDREEPISQYPTGTVLSWKDGKNRPCTQFADHMRMGIAVLGQDSPLIQGAEPVLVTGPVEEGDYLVTSRKEGHAEAMPRHMVIQQQLLDCVIGKALESGEGESHLIKTWINI